MTDRWSDGQTGPQKVSLPDTQNLYLSSIVSAIIFCINIFTYKVQVLRIEHSVPVGRGPPADGT